MKINYRIYIVLIATIAVFITKSCTDETAEADPRVTEQRYLDLYLSSNYPDAEPLESGLIYIEETAGVGVSPDSGDWVKINHVSYTLPEDRIYESYIENVAEDNNLDPNKAAMYGPYKMENGVRNLGLTEGLSLMKVGGEASLIFHSDLGYGSLGSGPVGAYKSLKYEIELLEVIPDIEAYELANIATYMDTVSSPYDTIHDPLSDAVLYYIVDQATEGAPVGIDSTIQVAYKGYLLDGRVFDESVDGAPYEFKVGDYGAETSPIVGWHLGMEKFKDGEKGRLVIPYQLAYGEDGRKSGSIQAIPQYETLVFDIEIISVEPDDGDDDDPGVEPEP